MAYPQGTNAVGVFSAANFAYGVAGSKVPGLKLFSGNAATGAQSVTVANQWFTAPDGSIVAPLATTAPVLVGVGSTQDSVTPSAVTNSNTGYLAPGSGGLTATFTYTHGQGERVASGTVGLQEAINYVVSIGGGMVEVDAQWTTLQQLFTDGVCDYAKPGVGQQPTIAWQTYQDVIGNAVYGGTALPAAPANSGSGWAAPSFDVFTATP